MIRFRKVEIENFVCFDNLVLEPSTSSERPLTIIRAENGSGKTTLLRAILWGMYGEDSLPSDSRDFGLHLAEWEPDDVGMRTSVKIQFENDGTTRSSSSSKNELTQFQLIRQVTTVRLESQYNEERNFRREQERSELLTRERDGTWTSWEHGVDSVIDQLLPKELQEFFVIDADKAVDFVGGSSENKSLDPRKVKKKTTEALHNLLGIRVFEETSNRLEEIAQDFGRSATKTIKSANLSKLQFELDKWVKERDDLQKKFRDDKQLKQKTENDLNKCDDRLGEIMQGMGEIQGLQEKRDYLSHEIKRFENLRETVFGKLSNLLELSSLYAKVSSKEALDTYELLKPLHEQGKIPQRHLAFVDDLLRSGTCVCGQDLTVKSYRRKVTEMLAEGRRDQSRSDFLGNLFESARTLIEINSTTDWQKEREYLSGQLVDHEREITNLKDDKNDIEKKFENVNDEEVQLLYEEKRQLKYKLENINQRIGAANEIEPSIRQEIDSLQKKIDQRKHAESAAKDERNAELMTRLVGGIISTAYDNILCNQVAELSKRMNQLFYRMAENADDDDLPDIPDRRTTLKMITEVGIHQVGNNSFEIFARNKHGRIMPPTEINGASRRVLALAFILALCKESKTDAPLVADSLLNFMSGAVRRNTLRITSEQSSQPILLLTGSDLESDSEVETVHRYSGATYTLTAQWHAKEASNDGGGDVIRQTVARSISLSCVCAPREYCDICERDGQANLPGWTKRI